MMDWINNMKSTLAVLTVVLSAGTWVAVEAGDNRYVQQSEQIEIQKKDLRYKIDKLEFLKTKRQLSDVQEWELRRYKSDLKSYEGK